MYCLMTLVFLMKNSSLVCTHEEKTRLHFRQSNNLAKNHVDITLLERNTYAHVMYRSISFYHFP